MKWLKNTGKKAYAVWCTTWFVLPFITTYPLFRLFVSKPEWYRHGHTLNRIWSKLQLRMYLLPIKVYGQEQLEPNRSYVFAPNHSSFIDIPMLIAAIPGFLNFVGKKSLAKVPLWGPIYDRLYISVDRKSPVSRAKAYLSSKMSIDEGRSVVIFPEGTISEAAGKELLPFKDGPFKLAIEKQVPLVPVSMPYNQFFLPDVKGKLVIQYHPLEMTFHQPISTEGLTLADVESLKEKTYLIIQEALHAKHHEHQCRDTPSVSALSPA